MAGDADPKKTKIVVVVVEDDRTILDFLTITLEQMGYEVIPAEDGQIGLDCIITKNPYLVILDLMLPKIDGFSILKRMAESPGIDHIPVVVVSAYTANEATRRMVENQSNVRAIFTKPLRSKEFIEKLQEITAGI